ncbi:unnamed protein product [Orchesella dallaii]|uniref:RNA polymerase-associated protein CTR9 n=1 Tax=Orchesella dallaii TaxID=48710 RepID=A0ABP1RZR2_9HEXA
MDLVPTSPENSVRIPLKNTEGEYIDIEGPDLPPSEDVITALRDEDAHVEIWHRVACLYYSHQRHDDFRVIAEEGCKIKYKTHKESSISPLAMSVAAYFSQRGYEENDESLLLKATNWYNSVGNKLGVTGFEADYYVGRAFLYLNMKDTEQADKHFSFILSSLDADFIPALLGKGFIAFGKQDYQTALSFFRRVLTLDPYHPTNVRVCIGHCFWKLNQREKAKIAFERALEVQPDDVDALSALAVYHLSTMKQHSIVQGMKMLAQAYSKNSKHAMTLIFLADHYYFKRDFDRSLDFALRAFTDTSLHDRHDIRKLSAFILGRNYQAKEDFKLALHYFYEALKEPENGFLLPNFGLAHCYLHLNDVERSINALNKILSKEPNNFLARKMFGVLACSSENTSRRTKAQEYLKSILENEPEDRVSRIALATALEGLDDTQSYENYKKVLQMYHESPPPEILNNVGSTLFSLQEYAKAYGYFRSALQVLNNNGRSHFSITVQYNIARALEALCDYRSAETLYKEILNEHPSYYSCFIRLAVMAREKGNLYDSSTHFKEALEYSRDHPDVWAFLGSLHLGNQETLPARQKFLRILDMSGETKHDSYASVALGNVTLNDLHRYIFDKTPCHTDDQRMKTQYIMSRALNYFKTILEKESNNIYAANGVGCILALKGLLTEAREVFSQVREATTDFKDVWMNIAHTYLEQDMYFNAAQMYETISKKFSLHSDFKLLQYIAKAHYLNGSYEAARIALLKCRRVAPQDPRILFVLGLTLRKLGWKTFSSQKADLKLVQDGYKYLNLAFKIFQGLEGIVDSDGHSRMHYAASEQARFCDDLIKQTPHMMSRVEAAYKEEQKLKSKREMEMKAFRERQYNEKMLLEQKKKEMEDEVQKRRDEVNSYAEKVKKSWEAETIVKRKKEIKEEPEEVHFIQINEEDLKPRTKKSRVTRKKRQQKADSDEYEEKKLVPPLKLRLTRKRKAKRIVDDDDSDSPSVSTAENVTASQTELLIEQEVEESRQEATNTEIGAQEQDATSIDTDVKEEAKTFIEAGVNVELQEAVDDKAPLTNVLKCEDTTDSQLGAMEENYVSGTLSEDNGLPEPLVSEDKTLEAAEDLENRKSSVDEFNRSVTRDYDNLDINIFSFGQVTNGGNRTGAGNSSSQTVEGNGDSDLYEGLPVLVPFNEEEPEVNDDFDFDCLPPVLHKADSDLE